MLYRSASGRDVNHASSSSLDVFRTCRRKFKLSRIEGWKTKGNKASLAFGTCVESAVQFYHSNGLKPGDCTDEFQRLWAKWIDQELVYTNLENSWKSLNTIGSELTRLYEIILPDLPIRNPRWQLEFRKNIFPNTEYGDLEFLGYVDLLSTLEDGTRTIVDIKTAKSELPVAPGMMALDGQLRKYAWVSGITNVALLNFVKAEPEGFKKGVGVTLLEDVGGFRAGRSLTTYKFTAPKDGAIASEGVKASPAVAWGILVGTEETVRELDEILDTVTGKGSAEKKEAIVASFLADGKLISPRRDQITKTRIQFLSGTIPEEELGEIGEGIGADTWAMLQAAQKGSYSADGGVRFPNNVCVWCEMRGICTKNDFLRDELLVQIKPVAADEDEWLKELEKGEEE